MTQSPGDIAFKRTALGVWSWPSAIRLPSWAIAMLFTVHTVALALDLNVFLDASLTVAALLLLLVLADRRARSDDKKSQTISPFAMAAIVAVAVATLFNASVVAVAKLAVLAGFYVVVPMAIARYRRATILAGMVLYGIAETAVVLGFSGEFNPNAAGHRVIVAICVLGLCFRPRWMRYLAFGCGVALAIAYESRTALGAAVIALGYVEVASMKAYSALRKFPIVFLAAIGLVIFFVRSESMDYLVHRAPVVVQEFFTDKRQRDLQEDPFDRQLMWRIGTQEIGKRPLVGIGLGNEQLATGKFRAHSAYLKLAIECGIPAAIVVVVFFLAMLQQSFANLAARPDALRHITCFCLVYLLISGFFESSGMFSIGTPTNLIAYCGFCWVRGGGIASRSG